MKDDSQLYHPRLTGRQRDALILAAEMEISNVKSLIERDARGKDLREALEFWSALLETLQGAAVV